MSCYIKLTGQFIHKIGAVALKLFQKIKLFFAADNHHFQKKTLSNG